MAPIVPGEATLHHRLISLCPLQVADKIRPTVDKYSQAFPALLEIPSCVSALLSARASPTTPREIR